MTKRCFLITPLLGSVFFLLLASGCIGTINPPTSAPLEESSIASPVIPAEQFQIPRQKMLDTIRSYGMTDEHVLRAMESTPRHAFVPQEYLDQAYANHPLPIGYGQTISQPFIVAWMTELLDLQPGEKVLEIGTGSGYQAAVLVEFGEIEVYSIEIVPELAEQAALRLKDLGYGEIRLKEGDGYFGWEEFAPFDAIIVTAAPDHLPPPLAAQLVDGGRIVIPIGPPGGYQTLWKFTNEEGILTAQNLGGVAFVPLTGEGVQEGEGLSSP